MKIEAVPFARKVLEFAEQEHEDYQFDMGTFWGSFWDTINSQRQKCGTAACLAGTAVFMDPEVSVKDGEPYLAGEQLDEDGIEIRGRELMGLSVIESCDLFYIGSNGRALAELRRLIEEAEKRESAAD